MSAASWVQVSASCFASRSRAVRSGFPLAAEHQGRSRSLDGRFNSSAGGLGSRRRPRHLLAARSRPRGHVHPGATSLDRGGPARCRVETRPGPACRPDRVPHGRGGFAGRLQRVFRVPTGSGGDQPSLRPRLGSVPLDPGTQLPRRWIPRILDGRRTSRDAGLAGLRGGVNAGLRSGRRSSMPGERVLRRPPVQAHQVPGDPRRSTRLRAGGRHRSLRRRHRQLAMAATHRRLRVLPGLRVAAGRAGRSLAGQRALRAGALPRGVGGGARRRRLRNGHRLSRWHLTLRPPRHGGEPVRARISAPRREEPGAYRGDRDSGSRG